MDTEKVKERILQWQLLAEQFTDENANVFIKELNGDLHFCKIVIVGETKVTVDNHGPTQRAGTRDCIDWLNIETFSRERVE